MHAKPMLYNAIEHAAQPLLEAFQSARHILVTSHINPDGDAIGSVVGISRVLRQLGRTVTMVVPTALPGVAAALPDAADVQVYADTRSLPDEADLVLLLDTGSVARIEPISTHEREYLAARPLIIIDHHATNTGEGMLNLVMTEAAATCEILALLVRAWKLPLDAETATALLLGLITDTQSFQTTHTSPRTLEVAADLLQAGGRLNDVVRSMLFAKPFAHARALGLAMERLHQEGPIIWTEFTQAMQRDSAADDEAGDEITAYISRIGGAQAYVLFKERRDGTVKISLRSAPGINVGSVAQALGGGGHREAAGATLEMPLDEARPLVLAKVRALLEGNQ
jgi:phosphoesterase RecJ-like protein